jgi:phosphate transport system protein
MTTNDHLSTQFDADLEGIRSGVLRMGGLVEEQVRAAIDAYTDLDAVLAQQVMTRDAEVNSMEMQLDDDCAHIIAKRQPAAKDLRLVIAVVKSITDLERIGDEASKIARMAKQIAERPRMGSMQANDVRLAQVRTAGEIAITMLRQSLDSFARMDTTTAASVVRRDAEIDAEFSSIARQLITFMMEDPRTISAGLDILWIAKAIERVGDHAKNISEYVVYVVKGMDVRHASIETLERAALGT